MNLLEEFRKLISESPKEEMDKVWDSIMEEDERVGPTIEEFLKQTE